uniref:Facilitated trehalose transporter Tret1 n=1 Tax=Ceratitis capitata TaxID=7213 RepID=W8CAF5_CERCA
MEERSAYPPARPVTFAPHQQPYAQPNYGTMNSDDELPPQHFMVYAEDDTEPPTYPPINGDPQEQGWFARMQINKPQSNSAGAAALVLMTGGMNIAWSAGFGQVKGFLPDTHILICWYIAAMIGALVSAFITNHITRRPIYLFASFLVVIGGILLVALPNEHRAIAAARYINGFAVGLVIVPMMVLIGEEVVPRNRGVSAALLETGSFAFGIFLQIIFFVSYSTSSFSPMRLHGIIAIIYALLTCLFSYFLVVESPVYHLQRNNEHAALDCLRRLQRPCTVTQESYQLLEEHKRYISESDSSEQGLPALAKLCFYRGLVALSFSPVVTLGLMTSAVISEGVNATWPLVVFGIFILLGAYVAGFVMDMVGRKIILLSGALICGVVAITIGGICNDFINLLFSSKMSSVLYMLFALQFFAGFFNSSASAYMTEAFPLHRKTYYIAASFNVQMLVWLIVNACNIDPQSLGPYFITFGVFYVVFFAISFLVFPETKHATLREAQQKFRGILNGW